MRMLRKVKAPAVFIPAADLPSLTATPVILSAAPVILSTAKDLGVGAASLTDDCHPG